MNHTYKGKVAVVTGGTSGIGLELARQLADAGATVIIGGKNTVVGAEVSGAVGKHGGSIAYLLLDVRRAESVESFMDGAMQQKGRIDYLFHCAGIIMGGEFRDNTITDIENLLTTNIHGTAYCALYAYRVMIEQGSGHIINLSSGAGLFPTPIMGVYSMSKFAVFGFSEMLRIEGKDLGVKVSVVTPGFVDTPIFEKAVYSRTDKGKILDLLKNKAHMQDPEQTARIILKGTAQNKAVIQTWTGVRLVWLQYRLFPGVYKFFTARSLGLFRSQLRTKQASVPKK